MTIQRKQNIFGELLILFSTLVWGISFVILKQTISVVPKYYVLAIRFFGSGILLSLVFFKKLKSINKKTVLRGVFLGLVLALGYITQTEGLFYTTPSRNAFLTSSYCILCPFLVWLLFRKRPKFWHIISAVLCIVGLGFIAFSKSETGTDLFLGDSLSLFCAIFFALQIVFIEKFNLEQEDPIRLLIIEILTTGIILVCVSLIFEFPNNDISVFALKGEQIFNLLYLTLVCTFLAQMTQIIGQKYTTSAKTALILSLESVFATIFSVIMGTDSLSVTLITGFVIVFISIVLSETQPDLKKLLGRNQKNDKTENNEENK